jgi:cytochrome c-type biogenesis protein CcmF
MLKVWNASLIVATFSLALLGTFLVRSGVLQSIHAFGESTVGPYILALIAVVMIGSAALIVSRLDDLRSERRIDSLISREAVFLINNLLLIALCVAIFWGTFFPLISEFFTGEKSSLAAPWFDRYTTPLAVVLVLFTGIGPLLAWRRVSWESARRVFLWPVVAGALTCLVLLAATPAGQKPWALALFSFAGFALTGLAQEFWRGAAGRRTLAGGSMPAALVGVVSRNRRRYGGYIVHIGVVVLLVGIAASSSFQTKQDVTLRPGQSSVIDGRKVTYVRPTVSVTKEALGIGAVLRVEKDGHSFNVTPSRRFFRPTGVQPGTIRDFFNGEATSEVGLRAGAFGDFWAAVQPNILAIEHRAADADRGFRECVRGAPGAPSQCRALAQLMRAAIQRPQLAPAASAEVEALQGEVAQRLARTYITDAAPATFRVIINPLVTWMWIGGLIALSGALIAIWPARGPRLRPAVATDLDALKEAKYREIRDAELDHAAGKLSDEDFALLDAELRTEAVEILERAGANGNGGQPEKITHS